MAPRPRAAMRAAAALAAGLTIAGAGVALADTQRVSDPRDASPSRLDIRRANAGHAGSRRVHTISMNSTWRNSVLRDADSTKYLCIFLWRGSDPAMPGRQDFQVCAMLRDRERELSGTIYSVRSRKFVSRVSVSRPSSRTIRFAFPRSVLRDNEYQWLATSRDRNEFDAAPPVPRLHQTVP